jgi:hypothetical protein
MHELNPSTCSATQFIKSLSLKLECVEQVPEVSAEECQESAASPPAATAATSPPAATAAATKRRAMAAELKIILAS